MHYLTPDIVFNKRVLMRVDYNVDLDDKQQVIDDFRIIQTVPTIKFLLKHRAKRIVLISHRGRPTKKEDFSQLSLRPISKYLEKILKQDIYFIQDFRSQKNEIENTKNGSIILLENIRFYPEEEQNDIRFAKELSTLGDIYINDAFSVSHRSEASLVLIPKLLPAYGGLLLEKELQILDKIKNITTEKLIIILGGNKIKDKLPLIKIFVNKAKYILVGGALANTIIKSWGFEIGDSLIDEELVSQANNLGSQKGELVIPGDYIVLNSKNKIVKRGLGEINKNDKILDIGPITAKTFSKFIQKADLILWNGPLGKIEDERFRAGTKEVLSSLLHNSKAQIVIGGGDTLKIFKLFRITTIPKNIFLSTGGGATLNYLANESLPALDALQ